MKNDRRRVALIIESSRSYGRNLLRGIAQYSRTHGNWSLMHEEMTIDASLPQWLAGAGVNGVIARVDSHTLDPLRQLSIPIVDVRCRNAHTGIPQVETDDRAVARLAYQHLSERGFQRFAFCGFREAHYSYNRLRFFRECCEASGKSLAVYETDGATKPITSIERAGLTDDLALSRWLKTLQPATGLLVCNDIRGHQVLAACRDAGILVPDELGVVGVDDDDVICPLCDPPLSSVRPDAERVGYRAAAVLDELMQGNPVHDTMELVPPVTVTQRMSTQVSAVEDRELARVCRFIREHACDGIDVNDVVEYSALSRRALERRFRQELDRTPHQELMNVQVARVKQLLKETSLKLEQVSRMAGYSHPERLGVVFKRETGMTPGEYRRQANHAGGDNMVQVE
ncbi:AraC family transcriptional regulator [Neorhodopirellula lusitana]|uniref:AraC family transcriptional regulator n=1 Tax=Neorhodopirellula lusitana TaxID=445327 RepID=UPI00384A6C3B